MSISLREFQLRPAKIVCRQLQFAILQIQASPICGVAFEYAFFGLAHNFQ
jgi:hypothetical protein